MFWLLPNAGCISLSAILLQQLVLNVLSTSFSYLLSKKINMICSSDCSCVKETCAILNVCERGWNFEEHLPSFVCNTSTSPICFMLFSLISLTSLFPCVIIFIYFAHKNISCLSMERYRFWCMFSSCNLRTRFKPLFLIDLTFLKCLASISESTIV